MTGPTPSPAAAPNATRLRSERTHAVLPKDGRHTGQWPLNSTLELGALPGAVPCARLHTRLVLQEWGLAPLVDSTELIVSEILTNSVKATQAAGLAAPVRLWLLADAARVLIQVWDATPWPPAPTAPADDAESGRGLLLVETLSARWDWYPTAEHGGKVVWAIVDTPLPPEGGHHDTLTSRPAFARCGRMCPWPGD
jgi:anti-sigma regulatory factor (Ser/Thr protein kinase)